MGLIANVVPNAPIASTWGNSIRDRTLQAFATTTERDAQWTAPPLGAQCITVDTLTRWIYTGTAWAALSHAYYSARMTRAAAMSGIGTTPALVVFDTKTFDPSNSWNTTTGAYTCKVAGQYLVKVQVSLTLGTVYKGNAYIFKNGAMYTNQTGAGDSGAIIPVATDLLVCAVGETIDGRVSSSVASNAIRTQPTETNMFVTYLGG